MKSRRKNSILSFLFPLILILVSINTAATKLSYEKIKDLYREGDFAQIQKSLEGFLKKEGATADVNEKIFSYKYLGVCYAADTATHLIAENYFLQLFKLAPNAHLADLYVSSSVQKIFTDAKDRYFKDSQAMSDYDEFGNPKNAKSKKPIVEKKSSHANDKTLKENSSTWIWVGVGGAAILGAGVYLWIANQKSPQDSTVTIKAGF